MRLALALLAAGCWRDATPPVVAQVPPAVVIDAAPDAPATPIAPEEIEELATTHMPGAQRCYARQQKNLGGTREKLSVTITVEPNGAISDVQLSAHGDDAFGKCVASEVRAWRLHPSPEGGTFRFMMLFQGD